jgi:glycosyltransferase involved in cell wall biosynthesis
MAEFVSSAADYCRLFTANSFNSLKVLHHERKRLEGHFSIERLFAEIRRCMPADCEVTSCPAPEASAGILPRWRNVRHAARQTANVHHIVGDSHYLAFGLPQEKTVLTIHDCGALNRLTGLKRALLKYFWFTGPMRRAAVVTTISQASKDELRKWVGSSADKVVVVPDCVFEEFTYDPKPFNEESPVVLQVGTKWNKNVERVIEAVRGTGFRLEIVGNLEKASHGLTRIKGRISPGGCADLTKQENSVLGDPSTRNALPEGKPTEEGSDSRIRELGRLTDEELVQAYRRCDMVVFASLYEGFGLPILEAQAMGRPVITSNFGAMKEAAGDGALFVDPYSVEAIREAVLRIKREPALREDLIAKGLRNAAKFSADAVALKYAQIYKSLATD